MIETTEIVLPGIVEPSGLQIRTRELPAPGPEQVVLRVDATGVSFAEQQMRLGKYYGQPPFPFVPGYDAVGTVTAAGTKVDPALVGRNSGRLPRSRDDRSDPGARAGRGGRGVRTVAGKVILTPDWS